MKRLQCNVKLSLFNKILRGNILLNPSKGPQWDLGGNLPRSNLVWVFPEADPRQGSGGKKYTWEMKENIGRRGRQGREAG